jgi:tripeptide aminopeptidase
MKKRATAKAKRTTTRSAAEKNAPAADSLPEANYGRAEKLLMELLAIPGVSGREAPVMEFITRQLRKAGVSETALEFDQAHRRSTLKGNSGNLVCRLPGTIRGPRRMLSAHVDTVPLCEGVKPVRHGDIIQPADENTALGADDRAGVAVILSAALDIVRRGLEHPPLTFLWTVQEEVGLFGARHARIGMLGKPRLAFNFDGGKTDKLTIGATGGYRMKILVSGVASHAGGAPEEGVSAITIASLAIADLHKNGWHGQISKGGRRGTSNVGVIVGGNATNVVTPLVEIRAEARSHDSAFRERIIAAIERAFRQAAKSVKNVEGVCGDVQIEGHLDYEAFKLGDAEPCVLAAEAAVASIGSQPIRAVCNGGLDANWLSKRGIPTVTLGCGQINPHTTREKLDVAKYRQACTIGLRLATGKVA